jgi:RNA polymerase sigma-70 factor (ECF subfamily)
MLYRDLFIYASQLFEPLNIQSEDMIQDVFVDIWKRRSVRFASIEYLRSFCFVALKNTYKNRTKHLRIEKRFELESKIDSEFRDDMERVDLFGSLYDSLEHLPEDYATVIRMYLQGYKPEEIASQLGIALQTVYNKRREAILMLKRYF